MKQFLVGLSIFALSTFSLAKGDVANGEKLAAQCTACHGVNGNSAVANFPKLAGQNEKYIIKQLMDMNKAKDLGGRPVPEMTGILMNLSEQDFADLAAYFSKQTIQGGAAKAELVELGEKLYRGGNVEKRISACSGCHGPDGKGIKGAGYPALAGQHADYLEKQLKAFRLGADQPKANGSRVNDGDPSMMRTISATMSDLEIKAIASYLSGVR